MPDDTLSLADAMQRATAVLMAVPSTPFTPRLAIVTRVLTDLLQEAGTLGENEGFARRLAALKLDRMTGRFLKEIACKPAAAMRRIQ